MENEEPLGNRRIRSVCICAIEEVLYCDNKDLFSLTYLQDYPNNF